MNCKFEKQKRAGRTFVRGFVTKAEYTSGMEIAIMAPTRRALRELWKIEWPHKPFDPAKVKPFIVVNVIPRRRKGDPA